MVVFLKERVKLGKAAAAAATDAWNGTCCLTGVLGALVADTYTGRYKAVLLFTASYLPGLVLLAAAASSAAPSRLFVFVSLYLIALGKGGVGANLSTYGADQFSSKSAEHGRQKLRFFSLFYFGINVGSLVASTALVSLQSKGHWGVGYGIPALSFGLATCSFLAGTPRYRAEPRRRPASAGGSLEPSFREKAAALSIALPFVCTNAMFWAVYSQMGSSFVLQGTAMNGRVGKTTIPAASLNAIDVVSVLFWIPVFEALIFPAMERRGVRTLPLRRMASGYVAACLAMVAAAATETRRLRVAHSPGGLLPDGTTAAFSILWQVPHFALVGLSESLCAVAEQSFFYDLSPPNMRSLFAAARLVAQALGGYLASSLVLLCKQLKVGGKRLFPEGDFNDGRLDLFYTLLALLMLGDLFCLAAAGRRAERMRVAAAVAAAARGDE